MPAAGKIADGWIQIGMKGFEAAKTQLVALQGQAQKITSGLAKIGSEFKMGFAVATGSIVGLLKAADPVRFEIFTQKLTILAIHIGRIFIPLLEQAIGWLDKLTAYFKGLSDEQRSNILHWSKIGLVILGAGSALATVGGAIAKVISLLGSLWSVISGAYGVIAPLIRTLGKIIPIGKVFRLLALAFMLFRGEGERVGGVFSKLQASAMPVLEKIWKVFKQIIDIVVRFGGIVGDMVDGIFGKLGDGLLDVLEEAMPLIEWCLRQVASLLDLISDGLEAVIDVIKDAQAIYTVLKEKKVSEIPKAVAQGFTRAVLNDGSELAKSLTFGLLDDTIDSVRDFVKDDIVGGKADEDAMMEAREKLDTGAGDFSGDKGAGGSFDDEKKDNFSPLRGFKPVQTMGIEEAFKNAQKGAGFDPSKLSAFERESLAKTGKLEELLKGILTNTGGRPGAAAEESF